MNKYEKDKLKECAEKIEFIDETLKHLSLREPYLYPILAHVIRAKEGLEAVLLESDYL